MIAGDIGEGSTSNVNPIEPMLLKAMARRFQRKMRYVLFCKRRQVFMKRNRIGRGVR